MANKLTAIEWLREIAKQREPDKFDWEQAKEMERRNIEEAWNDGTMLGRNGWVLEEYSTGKEYVQRSYGNANTSSL